jgi:hypothetical protein
MTEIRPGRIGTARPFDRDLFFAEIARLGDWPNAIAAPDPHFVAFVAANFRDKADAELEDFGRKLVEQGAAYLSAWGPDCERMHTRFDLAIIELRPAGDADDVILTTDHADESLDEALWDVLFVAWPAAKYETNCDSVLAIAVGNDEWAPAIRRRLSDPDQLNDAVLSSD